MGWRYQARKKTYDGEVVYELVEAYPDLMEQDDTIILHTVDAVTISADSKDGLVYRIEELAKWFMNHYLTLKRFANTIAKSMVFRSSMCVQVR